jgi:hypothetical protein
VDTFLKYGLWSYEVAVPAMQKRVIELQERQKVREQEDKDFYLHFDKLIAQEDVHTNMGNRNILAVAKCVWDTFEVDSKDWVDFLEFMKSFSTTVNYTAPEAKAHCWSRFASYMDAHHKGNDALMRILNNKT